MKAEKKKKVAEKKKRAAEKKAAPKRKKRKTVEPETDEEEVDSPDLHLELNDSSEYSDEVREDDDWLEAPYPFAEKEAEVRDLLLFLQPKFFALFCFLFCLSFNFF